MAKTNFVDGWVGVCTAIVTNEILLDNIANILQDNIANIYSREVVDSVTDNNRYSNPMDRSPSWAAIRHHIGWCFVG